MTFAAIVVAAGTGSRAANSAGIAKQWRTLGGKPVLRWSVEALLKAGAQDVAVVVSQAGLKTLTGRADQIVLIHDAARPLLGEPVIRRLLEALKTADGALPALPVADTLKKTSGDAITGTVDREHLWRAQTPQAFRRDRLEAAWANWPSDQTPTDDCAVVEADGGKVVVVEGDARLMKLTFPEDFAMAEALIAANTRMQTRVGSGFDAHRWGPGGSVWLCGVEIPHDQTLIGHSDADAGLHALTDAILGALGDGDIGDHFPPTDPKWKGASSDLFLAYAADKVTARGGRMVHVDVTLICERPKVKPHRQAMRERLAEILSLPLDAVSVKATTTEAMGFTGRGEGLAAQAVATIELPAA
jgi:2-C-methyl-D-erythritol 4-phosphate cytidylyltransferase/2-C-methyl-D-erythritol 2,4-cyclodiphosphate synthase